MGRLKKLFVYIVLFINALSIYSQEQSADGGHVINLSAYKEFFTSILFIFILLLILLCILIINLFQKQKLIHTDMLTGLPNRQRFKEQIHYIPSRKESLALFIIDLDDFKRINDVYGHIVGDEVFKMIGKRLQKFLSKNIFIARISGDEFGVILYNADRNLAKTLATRLIIELDMPYIVENLTLEISASIGIVCYPEDTNDNLKLMPYADDALYRAKAHGKNSFWTFSTEERNELERRNEVEQMIEEAIANDGFEMFYQPQFFTETRELSGFEALIRFKEHKVSPAEFIPLAEKSRKIITIDRIITEKVIRQMHEWQQKGLELVNISLNFSNYQIGDLTYPDYVLSLLKKYSVPAKYLKIEVTESTYLEESLETQEFMNNFINNGIDISIDDFGAGYSSIRYLNFLRFSELKLDKSLLDKYLETKDERMIASIISLAHTMNCITIAEGVEVEEQAQMLLKYKCDCIQGYLLGKPEKAADAERRLKKKDSSI